MKALLATLICVVGTQCPAISLREANGVRWLCAENGRRIVGVGPIAMKQKGWTCETTCSTGVDRVDFVFRAHGGKGHPDGWMLNLPLGPKAVKDQTIHKLGRWRRFDVDPDAEPMEHPLGKYKVIRSPQGNVLMRLPGNENWTGPSRDSVSFADDGTGVFIGHFTLFPMRDGEEPHECVARVNAIPFALKATTDRRNNLFDSNTPTLTLSLAETLGADNAKGELAVVIRDWDGREVFARKSPSVFKACERKKVEIPLSLPGRGLYFAEASLGGEFVRTTLAVIPPFEFRHRDQSVIGINLRCGRIFKNEQEAEYALVSRLGFAYLRNGDNRLAKRYGMEAGFSSQLPKSEYKAGDEESARQVAEWLDKIAEQENGVFEFGNEIGHRADTPTRHRLYDRYSGWLDAIRAERQRRGMNFQILYGTSSRRPELVRLIADKGIFNRLDALVVHPGRLNWTSDLDGDGWRYLGLVRNSRLLYESVGQKGKPIYLTETYTKTRRNDCHSDSLRQSAENAVLNAVLAMAEGCRRLCAYQLHEGVSYDENGIDLKDTEYSYGILNRDNSLKPSAIAYETCAEELDGAKFVRWISRDGAKLCGCLFDTPTGPLAVLWDRTEGYDLRSQGPRARQDGKAFFHFEPWLDNWRVRTPYVFATSGKSVTIRDAIGRTTTIPAKGSVRLELTGAPVFVRGLAGETDIRVDAPFDPKGGHIQGMCKGDGCYYLSQASHLFKVDLQGKCLKDIPAIIHTGDLCFHNGKLYTASAIYFGPRKGQGLIQVFDPDLKLLKEKHYDRSMDGIAALNGKLYVGCGCHPETVPHAEGAVPQSKTPHLDNDMAIVDPETLELERIFAYSHGYKTRYGAQNIVSDGKVLYIAFYPGDKNAPDFVAYDAAMKPLKCWRAKASNGIVYTGEKNGKPTFIKCVTTKKDGLPGATLKDVQLKPIKSTKGDK